MKLRFHKKYAVISLLLLTTEILIAAFANDKIIRPYIGDVLVVILMYCFTQTFFKLPVIYTAIAVLLFAFSIEGLQYINIVKMLGYQHNTFTRLVLGSSYSTGDLLAYTAGIVIVILFECRLAFVGVFTNKL
jgi:hypothetical protein